MSIWHWPQYGIALWYGMLIFVKVILAFKQPSGEAGAQNIGDVAIYLLLIVTLHCGGFW